MYRYIKPLILVITPEDCATLLNDTDIDIDTDTAWTVALLVTSMQKLLLGLEAY